MAVWPPQVLPNLASALLSLSRLPSGEGMEEEPLYVNAKQYHRILKRRQARAKLEAEGKIPKQRQVSVFLYCSCVFIVLTVDLLRGFC